MCVYVNVKACVNGYTYVVKIHVIWIYVNVHIGMYTYDDVVYLCCI